MSPDSLIHVEVWFAGRFSGSWSFPRCCEVCALQFHWWTPDGFVSQYDISNPDFADGWVVFCWEQKDWNAIVGCPLFGIPGLCEGSFYIGRKRVSIAVVLTGKRQQTKAAEAAATTTITATTTTTTTRRRRRRRTCSSVPWNRCLKSFSWALSSDSFDRIGYVSLDRWRSQSFGLNIHITECHTNR